MSTVLFDAPGPRAVARHRILATIGIAVAVGLLGWVLWKLWQEGEFEAELWQDLAQANILRALGRGLVGTLTAAVVAIILSVMFGAIFASARLSDHAFVRWPATVVIEFFRAVPLLLLILFLFLA